MANVTRKTFLLSGLSTMGFLGTVAGAPAAAKTVKPVFMASGSASAGTSVASLRDAELIPQLNPVIRLYPAKALSRTGEFRFGPGELEMMLPFLGAGEIAWTVNAPEAGKYNVALCYSTTEAGTPITVSANGEAELPFAATVTEGFFYPHPNGPSANPGDPDSDTFWTLRQYYMFERVAIQGELSLVRGVNIVKLAVKGEKGREIFRLRSLELTPVSQVDAVAAADARAKASRSNTDWFANAGYGMWFHFLDLTTPPKGPRIPYKDAVNALDVKKLAKMVDDCGASYLIFTVNHGNPTCPAPIKSWEALHPGWTTERDLIAELADALGTYGIRLMLYMNCPGVGKLVQMPGTAVDLPTYSEAEYSRQLISVFEEFGRRYGEKLAGYWFDSWFQTLESYPNLPNERLYTAMKTGHPNRLVSVNHWSFPTEVQWQDYWCGEITDLPAKPFGARYIKRGAGAGLQAHASIYLDAPWFHITENKEMEPPRYSAQVLADYIRTCQKDQAPVTIGVGIYQDGTIGPNSFTVLKELRGLIRTGRKRKA
ncbi:alpha-L-fucosidase [Asticcacaulis sp. 201]|uniref:alpha-L-fucosidase n=1 Tax=Asticcacaulis sp. 201 TaxID=3028787 RepID=UPI0029163BFF|nr:alpha-L-fucosidase [Asticcacaulis sp. 201]MDV6330692.1 alpha-L-fucosidase [Asticcacaulis sp. 201]